MKILGRRVLRGPNMHTDHPVCRLVVAEHADIDVDAVAVTLAEAGLEVDAADLGRLVGSVALALQRAVGLGPDGQTADRDPDGDWIITYGYVYDETGLEAGTQAVALVAAAASGASLDLEGAVARLEALRVREAAPASVEALLEAARRRGIPTMRRDVTHHQLGWGHLQEQLWGTMTGRASGLGFDIANDHERILEVLEDTGIPVPRGGSRRSLQGCLELAEDLRYPVAVKPLRGRSGVTARVDGAKELEAAYDRAKALHRWVVIEDHVRGIPHRVLVVGDQVIGALRISDGADVTDTLHPAVALACCRARRLVGLDVVGIDLVANTLDAPLSETRGSVVSVHPRPDLGPYLGRGAAAAILDLLLPTGDGRIPLVAVTGTNGKTTTVRLISHILKYAGARVGMACTGAVEVENQVVLRGDYSGPTAARSVLREPSVTHAVCEVARGGILRGGLGFDACDVGVLLNVASDHLGEGGIRTLEDLTRLKGTVVRSVRPGGTVVLNADDPRVWDLRKTLDRSVIPFTLDPEHPDLADHLASDPTNVGITVVGGGIVLRRGAAEFRVAEVVDIPLTLEGAATFNVQNAMAATAVAYALELREEDCRAGLLTFNPSVNQLPGRMNLMQLGGVKVLLDYGHNVPALTALATVLPRLTRGRTITVANSAGNRRDQDLDAFGRTIAGMYDRIYLADPDPRRRHPGETVERIAEAIRGAGFDEAQLVIELDEGRAFRMAIAESRPGDLVVLQADDVDGAIRLCRSIQMRLDAGESPVDLNRELLGTVT